MALIGVDGAGKTTVARALEGTLAIPAKYMYMGVNWEASDTLLPTTRLVRAIRRARGTVAEGGPPQRVDERRPGPLPKRVLGTVRGSLALANRLAEEWYRQLVVWSYVRKGVVVVFDRHFFSDYYAHDVVRQDGRPLGRRLHGFLLSRLYPKPDLVIFLDAPASVLRSRKSEGTLEALERRRNEYLELAERTPRFVTIDANEPLDAVIGKVAATIESFAVRGSATGDRP